MDINNILLQVFERYNKSSYGFKSYINNIIFKTIFMDQNIEINTTYLKTSIDVLDKSYPRYATFHLAKMENLDKITFILYKSLGFRLRNKQNITLNKACNMFNIKNLEDKKEFIRQRLAFENY